MIKEIKAQGLPINVVVMMIIGIIIFGIGISLFSQISSEGDDYIEELNDQIRSDIANLYCDGSDWICSGSIVMKKEKASFEVFISNHGDAVSDYSITLDGDGAVGANGVKLEKASCGEINLFHPTNSISIESGQSAAFPVIVRDNGVIKRPCSFTVIANLVSSGGSSSGDGEKTPITVRVE